MIDQLISKYPKFNLLLTFLVVIISALLFAVQLNMFLIPGDIYSGGIAGLAQLTTYVINNFSPFPGIIQTGTLNFIYNIPVLLLSYFKLGKRFTILTMIVVAVLTLFTYVVPIVHVSSNPLLNAISAGVLGGAGAGLTIKYGMSAGGIDIISMVLYRATGINVGNMNLIMNSFIIVAAGFLYSWEFALYTLISMYVSSRVVNMIHTNEHRLTAFIVTDKVDEVIASIYSRIRRGITILDGRGGYSKQARSTLMIVVNRYELYDLQFAILEADNKAFINIIHSTKVIGNFLSREQQDKYRKANLNQQKNDI